MVCRLIHGDCLTEMPKLIDEDVKVDLVLTDLPYGTTSCKWDNIIPFDEMWDCINGLSKSTTPILLFGDEPFSSRLRLSNIDNYKYDWIWIKNRPTNLFQVQDRPMKYHEFIHVFYEKQSKYYKDRILIPRYDKRGRRKSKSKKDGIFNEKLVFNSKEYDENWKNPSQHIYFNKPSGNAYKKMLHPTQKPVALLEHFIKTYTDEGDLVLDFTMGSGSTGVACQNLNRNFIGIELDENYFSIAKERINTAQTKLI